MQIRNQIKATLKKNDIPRGLVATLARVYPADLSAWLTNLLDFGGIYLPATVAQPSKK
jgi:hypothetical protein